MEYGGRRKEIESFGVKLSIRVMKGFDVNRQLSLIRELEAEGISALAITPIDDRAVIRALNELTKGRSLSQPLMQMSKEFKSLRL